MYNCTLHNWQSLVDPCPLCLNPTSISTTSANVLPHFPQQSESFNDYAARMLRDDPQEDKAALIKQIKIRDKEIDKLKSICKSALESLTNRYTEGYLQEAILILKSV